jgi:hypothetical protein
LPSGRWRNSLLTIHGSLLHWMGAESVMVVTGLCDENKGVGSDAGCRASRFVLLLDGNGNRSEARHVSRLPKPLLT